MPTTTIKIPAQELVQIDYLRKAHGFQSRSAFFRYAALHFDESARDEATLSQLADAVFTLHQIRRAQTGRLHLLKKKDLENVAMLLSRIGDAMTREMDRQ